MANYLADRRKELGLTQKEIARMVGVSEGTVSRWESGEIANMRRDKIALYAKALEVTPSFIMTGERKIASPSEEAMEVARIYDKLDSSSRHIIQVVIQEWKKQNE